MATTISTQDIVDAKRDIEDIGEAVNEVKIVSPRYGEDFKSLPMIAAEAQDTISEWRDAINTIVDEDGVPALAVSSASGENQQDINDYNGAKWRNRAGGYDLNARVVLENGDIVKSTVAGNTVNPNEDMTGWIKTTDPTLIYYNENRMQDDKNKEFLSIQDYKNRAVGDYWTDALNQAIYDATRWGINRILIPNKDGVYYVKDVDAPAYMSFEGIGRKRRYNPTNISQMGGTCCIAFDTTGTYMIDFGQQSIIKNLNFYGVNKACNGLGKGDKSGNIITDVSMIAFNYGFGTDGYAGGAMTRVHATKCNVGIRNPVDSTSLNHTINDNAIGIQCMTGSNDNSFLGGKCEWNNENWSFYQARHININGGVTDRSRNAYNFSIKQSDVTISGHVSRRPSTSEMANSSHFLLSNNVALSLSGVITRRGANDDTSGTFTPNYIFDVENASGPVSITGGDMGGYITGFKRGGTLDYKAAGVIGLADTIDKYGEAFNSIGAASTASMTIKTGLNLATYSSVVGSFRVTVSTRDPSGNIAYNEFTLRVSRGAGSNASSVIVAALVPTSTAIAQTGAALNVAVTSTTENGSEVVLTLSNTSANTLQTRAIATLVS